MTNEQLRQRAQETADEHSNDAYSVALAMLERENKLEDELEDEINTRDSYHEWCDKLADEIARFLGVEIGEHSSANNPWLNAYEEIPESLAKIKAEAVLEYGKIALNKCERLYATRIRYHEALGALIEEANKLENNEL